MKQLTILLLSIVLWSCGGGSGGDDPEPTPIVNDPEPALLEFPEANSECTEGTDFTSTESTITFKWMAGRHTTSYKLELKDLKTDVLTSYNTSNTSIPIRLKRGNPYSWSVISKSSTSSKTAKSTVWKFYNAGAGTIAYAPFPAELESPLNNASIETDKVTLVWSASDIDNDIVSYDVYFGNSNPPELYNADVESSIMSNVDVQLGTYFWQIVTKDETGNSSVSEIYSFTVE